MEIDGNTIKIGTDTESPAHSRAVVRALEILSVFALFILPASANTSMADSMIAVAAMIDAMGVIWVAITDMIIDLVPLILIMALVGFIVSVFAMVLGKLKDKGLGK